jgi:signal transduction histidine kinase
VGIGLPILGLTVVVATAVGHARYGQLSGQALLLIYGWSSVWLAVGYVARRVRPGSSLGASMMLFGVGELIAAAGASYAGSGPAFAALRATAALITGVQLAWLLYIAMTLLRLRARRTTARVRAAVAWAYGVAYAVVMVATDDVTVRRVLAAGWGVLLSSYVAWMVVRWVGSPPRLRRVRAVPTLVGVLVGSLALLLAVDASRRGAPVWSDPVAVASGGDSSPLGALGVAIFWLCLVALPGGFLFGLVRQRIALARVADLVAAIGTVPLAELEPALAAAIGDPQLRLRFGAGTDQPLSSGRVASEVAEGIILVHDASLLEEPRLMAAVRDTVALAVEHDRLHVRVAEQVEEIRSSRARIVQAADAARRRIERDLHDGAQQRLLAAGLALQAAEARVSADAQPALAQAQAELRAALAELRDLARGIHPQVLMDHGLAAALHQLARHAPLPVRVVADGIDRLPPSAEVTAYFVVAEAVANAAKHARATVVEVTVHSEQEQLVVRVVDDGVGGAQASRGSGLTGLHDRLAAVEGDLELQSPPGAGTELVARIPIGGPVGG